QLVTNAPPPGLRHASSDKITFDVMATVAHPIVIAILAVCGPLLTVKQTARGPFGHLGSQGL
ncbi:MAG: hypothetical protein WAL14_03565, partial [Pseudolabrys sp.]